MPETLATRPVARLLFLHAQTGLHPGSGTALGTVDLPVQRERHTLWPTIPGSALKGILRDRCREEAAQHYQDDGPDVEESKRRTRRRKANEEDPRLVAAFGPGKVEESNAYAGALSVTDARLLAFPVRSLRGVFAWVTCPGALLRLNRDLHVAGLPPLAAPDALEDTRALCAEGSPLRVGDKVVLEEFEFAVQGPTGAGAGWLADHVSTDAGTRERLRTHLVILSDNYFTHFARNATEIVARVGLDYDRKTVSKGALFYQEFLPAETIFYSVVLASSSRSKDHAAGAEQIMEYLAGHLKDGAVLQVGGDETIGKGLCLAHLSNGKGA
jgi:CRISPR-associated protein Cmr4